MATLNPARKLTGPALVAALVALALWAVFVIVMIVVADTNDEVRWTRLAFLFASVEAVAFAAGGAMWGASIQRERAEKAEEAAAANQEDASSGRALAKTVIEDDDTGGAAPGGPERFGGAGGDDTARRHARVARALFPDL